VKARGGTRRAKEGRAVALKWASGRSGGILT